MRYIKRYWKIGLTLLFALCVTLFWALLGVSLLSFQEQYQLFLFTGDYFTERISVPGGFADYIAEFLTQWNYVFVAGAIIIGILLTVFQRLTWQMMHIEGLDGVWYPLSFIPALLLWAYMCNANVMLSFVIALILSELMIMVWRYDAVGGSIVGKVIFIAVLYPLSYWLIGPCMFVIAGYVLLSEMFSKSRASSVWLGIGSVVYSIAVVLVVAQFRPEPLYRLFGGLNYFRYPAYIPWAQMGMMALVAVFPFVLKKLPRVKARIVIPVQLAVILCGGIALVWFNFNTLANELIDYDYLVRVHAWDKIIAKAEKKQPSTPLEVSCVNFALSQKGELCDRLFEFYQNGGEGLFPTFTRDMLSPVSTGEIFYSLGMINDAERYFFEAQQAIPNFRRSGRLCKEIIDCEIINGNYKVARKLLHELQYSLFYSGWADSRLDMLGNERKINADNNYGKLRKFRVGKDYLFSDSEMDQMLGLVFTHCYDNRNAYEYLMAYELVQRDMKRFMEYYPIGKYAGYSDHIPYAIQQALLFDWTNTHGSFEGIPYSIDQRWGELMAQFIQTYMTNREDPSLSVPPLGNTFWNYMLINKRQAKKTDTKTKEIY